MPEKTRRPITVWIAQALLFTFGCAGGISFIMGLLASTELPPLLSEDISELAWLSGFRFALSVLFLSGFWSMAKRKNYGRWLGVAGFLSCIVVFTMAVYFTFDIRDYEGWEELLGAMTALVMIFTPFILLIYMLVLGKRVNEFFSPAADTAPGPSPEPPPPPSFDEDDRA